MSDKFDVHLIVPANLVGTIVELMQGSGVLVSMTPHEGREARRKHFYRGGKRDKGISADDAILEYLRASAGLATLKQLSSYLSSKYSFADSSAGAAVSGMIKEGLLTRGEDGIIRQRIP